MASPGVEVGRVGMSIARSRGFVAVEYELVWREHYCTMGASDTLCSGAVKQTNRYSLIGFIEAF